jgi:hypothetical protein
MRKSEKAGESGGERSQGIFSFFVKKKIINNPYCFLHN